MKKISFNSLSNVSIINEKENYIEVEEEKKFFKNIKIESFELDVKENQIIIDGNHISVSDMKNFYSDKFPESGFDYIVFRNCDIEKLFIKSIYIRNVIFENCNINELTIKNYQNDRTLEGNKPIIINGGTIQDFNILDNEFNVKVYINKQYDDNNQTTKITNLRIKNSIFNENFKLHKCIVENVIIKDTDFEKKADFYLSHFKNGLDLEEDEKDEIIFKALNFKDLALFGETKFFKKFSLKYVTLKGLSHFRGAEFKSGLDLDYANIESEMNFFDSKGLDNEKSKGNTSQETYRIIKHNFEKLGNKIEANKYHALELDQKRRKLKNDEKANWQEKWVFNFHSWSSEHSTNWLRSLLWIFIVGFITTLASTSLWFLTILIPIYLFVDRCKFDFLTAQFVYILGFISLFLLFSSLDFDCVFKYINVITKPDEFENNTIMTLNKVSLGYLYYQFLMSVRKDTRK